jgi:hypothetical protein
MIDLIIAYQSGNTSPILRLPLNRVGSLRLPDYPRGGSGFLQFKLPYWPEAKPAIISIIHLLV